MCAMHRPTRLLSASHALESSIWNERREAALFVTSKSNRECSSHLNPTCRWIARRSQRSTARSSRHAVVRDAGLVVDDDGFASHGRRMLFFHRRGLIGQECARVVRDLLHRERYQLQVATRHGSSTLTDAPQFRAKEVGEDRLQVNAELTQKQVEKQETHANGYGEEVDEKQDVKAALDWPMTQWRGSKADQEREDAGVYQTNESEECIREDQQTEKVSQVYQQNELSVPFG